jgi:hypothetical protein
MSSQAENSKECLSPGTMMALLDRELGAEEKAAAQAHLQTCSRCQQLAADLGVAAEAVSGLRCLDDEAIAAWVDPRAGRARGTVSEAEMHRRGEHLRQCQQCRERVELLAGMYTPQGLWGRVQDLLSTPARTWPAGVSRGLRWAVVAAVVLVGALVLYLVGPGRKVQPRPITSRPQVAKAPLRSGAQARRPVSPPPTQQARAPRATSAAAPVQAQPPVKSGGKAPTASGRRPTVGRPSVPRPEAALIPADEQARAEMARASRDLARARASGNAAAQAKGALELGGLYHEQRSYRPAARCYREAADAAARAGKVKLRVDALILEGAALAELGDDVHAHQQLELALGLARKGGYGEGEQNALAQLELLDRQRASRGH